MTTFTLATLADKTAYDIINEVYDVNAHFGKVGNMVRLFGDTVADRAEIWKSRNGYDVFIGKNTKLYGIGSALLNSDWSDAGKLRYSKSNELALKSLTGSDVALLLECVKRAPVIEEATEIKVESVDVTPKPKKTTAKRGKGKSKSDTVVKTA